MRFLAVLSRWLSAIYNFIRPFKDDRLNFFIFISVLLFAGYVAKLYLLTFVQGEFWIKKVSGQFAGVIKISCERGRIYDRNHALLAGNERVFSFYIRPSEVGDWSTFKKILLRDRETIERFSKAKGYKPNILFERLKAFESLSPEDIDRAYRKRFTVVKRGSKVLKVPFVWLKKRVSCSKEEAVKAVKTALTVYYALSGESRFKKKYPDLVGYVQEFRRVYPYRVGSVVLGVTTSAGEGQSGLELLLEARKIITGDTILLSGEKDTRGRVYLGKSARLFLTRRRGNDVVVTIDGNIQYMFEKTVEEYARKWKPNFINAVLMNPHTGDILAAVSYPFYRYGERRGRDLVSKLTPRFIVFPYEPGSVMKPIVLASAINEGLITENTVFYCPATYKVGNKEFKNEFQGRNVKLRAWEIIQHSDNVGIIKVAQLLGKEKLYHYLKAFGFGQKTGIELPGEHPGRVRHWKKWRDVEFATIAFGHNIEATTLQLAVAYSALVNGGVYVKPRLLLAVVDDKGNVVKRFPVNRGRRVISPQTSRIMRKILTMVVEGGTGVAARLENFYVGGKTGTALKTDPVTGDYDRSRITASFVGAFPLTKPRFVLAVTEDEPKVPKNMLWASKIAVPLFRELAERVLLYERVSPDRKDYRIRHGEVVSVDANQDFLLKNGLQEM